MLVLLLVSLASKLDSTMQLELKLKLKKR